MAQKYLTMSRHGIYYFQYWLPQHLNNDSFTNKVFRLSLKTPIKREAIKHSHRLITVIYELEEEYSNNPNLFGDALIKMKDNDFYKLLPPYSRLIPNHAKSGVKWSEKNLVDRGLDLHHKIKIGLNPNEVLASDIDTFCYDLAREQLKQEGEQAGNITTLSPASVSLESSPSVEYMTESNPLSECLKEYLNEKIDNNTAKSINTIKIKIDVLINVVGDKPSLSLNKDDIKTFKKLILKYPSNRNKKPAYRDKTLQEILKMDIPETDIASKATRDGYRKQVSAFLGWLFDNEYTKVIGLQSPLKGLFRNGGDDSEKVDAFDNEDLISLFENEYYFRRLHKTPSKYWIPLMALCTGARLNEMCQLYKSDIKEEKGIWYLDINSDTDDKHLKKPHHKRLVPIHKQLIKLGFVDYVKGVKTTRIFPELKYKNESYKKTIGDWFNRTYKKNCNVGQKPNESKTFHSFRHTFISHLVNNLDVSQPKIARLVGQKPSDKSVTIRIYTKKVDIEANNEIIQRIKWKIDYTKIRKW